MSQYAGAQGSGTYYQNMNGSNGSNGNMVVGAQKSGNHMSASGIGQQYQGP
jgi:hypothetical protein